MNIDFVKNERTTHLTKFFLSVKIAEKCLKILMLQSRQNKLFTI